MLFKTLKNQFRFKTFSQSGEDVIIKFLFDNILQIKQPSYIDIGAHHPFHLSNTNIFYENGCRGLNIDPNPEAIKLFLKYRKEDININCGVSDSAGELDFYKFRYSTHNTFDVEKAEQHKDALINVEKVKVNTVTAILSQYFNNKFPDLLSLDTEGLDLRILKSINYQTFHPKVICAETNLEYEPGVWKKNYELIEYLMAEGYMVYADTFINTIFCKKNYLVKKDNGGLFYSGLDIKINR